MEDVIQQRKAYLVDVFKKHKNKFVWVLLLVIILVGMNIRSQNFELLKDATTGDYISAELDSTLFLRYAEYIVAHKWLPDVDTMRFVPVGADLSVIGTFTSYFVAYLYYSMHLFDSSVTVAYADIVYPLVAMALMTLFLFLLVRRLLGQWVALLTAWFITVIPTFLFRSTGGSSDHDILGMMFLMIILYCYIVAYQSSSAKKMIIFGLLSSIAFILGRHTAGTVNFALFIMGAYVLVSIILNRFEKRDFYLFAGWLLVNMLLIMVFGKFGVVSFITSVTTGIAFVALLVAAVDFVIFKLDVLKWRSRVEQKIPLWLASLGFSVVVGALCIIVFFGPEFFVAKAQHIGQYLFRAYAESRWTLTVAENRKPFVIDWINQMSPWFVFFLMYGAIWLFRQMVRKLEHATKLTVAFGITVFAYVFSRYSPDTIFNGSSSLSHWLFYGSLIAFVVFTVGLFTRSFFKNREQYYASAKNIDLQYAFLIVWFLVMVMAATSAIRLLFEFSVIACIFAAYYVVESCRLFKNIKQASPVHLFLWFFSFAFIAFFDRLGLKETAATKSEWFMAIVLSLFVAGIILGVYHLFVKNGLQVIKYVGLAAILLAVFSPMALGFMDKGVSISFFESSSYQAANTAPSYNRQWQMAGDWVRKNTPEDAVFMHWWDYGYWVQEGFKRASVTDGGNFFVYWNYLIGRHILTGDNETEAFSLMKSHNVTHVLMVSDEIGKYGAYSSIGGDVNNDRFASIGVFGLNQQRTQELRNQTVFVYEGGVPLYESLVYNGVVYPPSTIVAGMFMYVSNLNISSESVSFDIDKVDVVLFKDGQQTTIPLSCVYYEGRIDLFKGADGVLPACMRILPNIQDSSYIPFGNALFISPKVAKTFFARLYLLDEIIPGFNVVYSDDSLGARLGVYNGNLWGPMRIWEIVYPEGTKTSNDYLLLEYPDERLKSP